MDAAGKDANWVYTAPGTPDPYTPAKVTTAQLEENHMRL